MAFIGVDHGGGRITAALELGGPADPVGAINLKRCGSGSMGIVLYGMNTIWKRLKATLRVIR